MPASRPMTRGPLPPEVYWRRRFFVITLAITIVFVIGSVLSGGSDGDDEEVVAEQAGAVEPSSTVTVPAGTGKQRSTRAADGGTGRGESSGRAGKRRGTEEAGPTLGPTAAPTTLAPPTGPCRAEDVLLTPVVEDGVAGGDITIGLKLQTRTAEACTWRVSRRSVAVKILDGETEVWTSRECPAALPDQTVTVRRVIATVVEMTWNGLESDRRCTDRADWVYPGDYTAVGAALGSEPGESTFDLAAPTASTVFVTPEEPTEQKQKKQRKQRKPESATRD